MEFPPGKVFSKSVDGLDLSRNHSPNSLRYKEQNIFLVLLSFHTKLIPYQRMGSPKSLSYHIKAQELLSLI